MNSNAQLSSAMFKSALVKSGIQLLRCHLSINKATVTPSSQHMTDQPSSSSNASGLPSDATLSNKDDKHVEVHRRTRPIHPRLSSCCCGDAPESCPPVIDIRCLLALHIGQEPAHECVHWHEPAVVHYRNCSTPFFQSILLLTSIFLPTICDRNSLSPSMCPASSCFCADIFMLISLAMRLFSSAIIGLSLSVCNSLYRSLIWGMDRCSICLANRPIVIYTCCICGSSGTGLLPVTCTGRPPFLVSP